MSKTSITGRDGYIIRQALARAMATEAYLREFHQPPSNKRDMMKLLQAYGGQDAQYHLDIEADTLALSIRPLYEVEIMSMITDDFLDATKAEVVDTDRGSIEVHFRDDYHGKAIYLDVTVEGLTSLRDALSLVIKKDERRLVVNLLSDLFK